MIYISKQYKKAQAVVELALIVPFLILLILSIVELGMFFSDFMQFNFAVQYAGDTGKVQGTTNTAIVQTIQSQLPSFNFNPVVNNGTPANKDNITIKPEDMSDRPNGGWIFIRATHPYKFITPVISGIMCPDGNPFPMTAYTTRRVE